MPDAFDIRRDPPLDVGEALRALPLERPPREQWSRLAAGLAERPRRRRWPLLLAAAAVLLAALALPRLLAPPLPGTAAPVVLEPVVLEPVQSPAAVDEIDALIAQSADLEALLAVAAGDDIASGASLLLRDQLHERIQYVDALLADPRTDASAQAPLWRERVVLLRRLAGIEGGEQLLASRGDAGDSTLVLTF